MESQQFYLKSPAEMEKLFGHVEGALKTRWPSPNAATWNSISRSQRLPEPTIPAGGHPQNISAHFARPDH